MEQGTLSNTNTEIKFAATCLNLAGSEHRETNAGRSVLSLDQVRTKLAGIELKKNGPLMRRARSLAEPVDEDPDDLLQEAILRAMTTRSWPDGVSVQPYLKGIMRSIASNKARRRERDISLGCLGDNFIFGVSDVRVASPEDELIERKSRKDCASLLALIINEDPAIEVLIDGRLLGMRGKDLAKHAGVGQAELATIHRRIKRNAQSVAKQFGPLEHAA